MKITDTATIDQHCNDSGEMHDGLFAFARAGQFAIDTAVSVGATKLYMVYEYEVQSGEPADLHNLSHLRGGDIYGLYTQVAVIAYTTQEEMHQHILAWMMEKNHY